MDRRWLQNCSPFLGLLQCSLYSTKVLRSSVLERDLSRKLVSLTALLRRCVLARVPRPILKLSSCCKEGQNLFKRSRYQTSDAFSSWKTLVVFHLVRRKTSEASASFFRCERTSFVHFLQKMLKFANCIECIGTVATFPHFVCVLDGSVCGALLSLISLVQPSSH